jgi:cysteine synthase A
MPAPGILSAIGNTPLVRLRRLVPAGYAAIHVKVESANPTGSMKDRMAMAAVEGAEAKGLVAPGGSVVEYTGGSTGTALAIVCAAKGYRLRIVTSDAFSEEKRDHMASLGAELTIVLSDRKRITEALIKDMIDTARQMSEADGAWWVDQPNNHEAARGYHGLGDEIWAQTGGTVSAFVQSVGTAHSSTAPSERSGGTTAPSGRSRSSRQSRPSCPRAAPGAIASRASASASYRRSGIRTRS